MGKGCQLTLVHSRKLTNTTILSTLFPAITVTVVRDWKIGPRLRTNHIARLVILALLGK